MAEWKVIMEGVNAPHIHRVMAVLLVEQMHDQGSCLLFLFTTGEINVFKKRIILCQKDSERCAR